jgi:hypothetical protein
MFNNNTSYGIASLKNNLGTDNSAFGAYTSYNNTTSNNNTSVGSNSSFFNTTGSNNTSIGAGSLCNNTTGSLNTAIGSSALEGIVGQSTGDANTAIGVQCLYNNEGSQNTAIGAYAALAVTGGNYNTFLGSNTTFDDVSQAYQYSTAIGYGAQITSNNQIVMGGNSSGQYPNVIIPGGITGATGSFSYLNTSQDALINNNITLGSGGGNINGNIALGVNVLQANSSGYNNVGIGNSALKTNTTATDNVAVGYNALKLTTSGGQNVAIGSGTLNNMTTGIGNVAIGYNTLYSNQTGQYNMGFGAGALYSSTGDKNVAIGENALQGVTSGSGNVAIGYSATSNGNSTGSTSIGYLAGNLGQNGYSIAIGYKAGSATVQSSNSIIIDATGSSLSTSNNGTYISPIISLSSGSPMYYDDTTKQLTYLSSSRKYKNTIKDLNIDTNVIYDLKPKTFLLNNDPNAGQQIGYIAEEVKEVHHNFAAYNSGNLEEPVSINFNTILVFLVEEVKKLKQENLDLKNEISKIKEKLN